MRGLGQLLQGLDAQGKHIEIGAIAFKHHPGVGYRQTLGAKSREQGHGGIDSGLDVRPAQLVDVDKTVDKVHQDQSAALANARGAAQALVLVNFIAVHAHPLFVGRMGFVKGRHPIKTHQ